MSSGRERASRVSDGAFYTEDVSAMMLAGLSLDFPGLDWTHEMQVMRIRLIDPACGGGALLAAGLRYVRSRIADAPWEEAGKALVVRILAEYRTIGWDIFPGAIDEAVRRILAVAPGADEALVRQRVVCLPHGPQADGTMRLGALEFFRRDPDSDKLDPSTWFRELRNELDDFMDQLELFGRA